MTAPEKKITAPNSAVALVDFGRISKFYDDLVQTYGHDARACDYGRQESQTAKFRVLGDIVGLDRKTVLDVGCGFADFYGYLSMRYPTVRYSGIDISENMVQEAHRSWPDLDVRVCNIMDLPGEQIADVVTANGIFYLLGEQAPSLMRAMVKRMFGLCKQALAFNSLSSWATDQEPSEFYADPLETIRWCRELSPYLALRHDYHSRDFTIYIYKEQVQ